MVNLFGRGQNKYFISSAGTNKIYIYIKYIYIYFTSGGEHERITLVLG